MNDQKNIDKLFKTKIEGFQVEPSEKVWKNIESVYFSDKGITRKWYYLGAAILLLLIGTGSYLYFHDNSGNKNSLTSEKSVSETYLENSKSITEKEDNAAFNEKINQNNNNKIAIKSYKNGVEEKHFITNEIVTLDSEKAETNYKTSQLSKNTNKFLQDDSGALPQIFSIDPLMISNIQNPQINTIDPIKVTGMEEFLEKQRKSHFYTGATIKAGMMYYPSTTDQFTWTAGLAFGITLHKIFFETGINYVDTKERGIYSIELKGRDSIGYFNQVESFEVDPAHPDQIIYNTKEVTVYDSVDHYTHTTPYFKYQYVNLQFSIGYKFFNRPRFSASIRTGIILSIMVSKNIPEADHIDTEYTIVRIQNNSPERADKNLIWQIGVRFNYKINSSVSLSAEPVFTKYINSIYNIEKNYPNVRPYTMGIQFGIYYGF